MKKKNSMVRKFTVGFIILGILICSVTIGYGYFQYKSYIQKQYNTTAYQVAHVFESYMTEEEIEEYNKIKKALDDIEVEVDKDSKLRIGDTIKDMAFNVPKAFGHGKDRIYEDLTVISASKDGNNIILMDKNRSFYELPRDSVREGYNRQQEKQRRRQKNAE